MDRDPHPGHPPGGKDRPQRRQSISYTSSASRASVTDTIASLGSSEHAPHHPTLRFPTPFAVHPHHHSRPRCVPPYHLSLALAYPALSLTFSSNHLLLQLSPRRRWAGRSRRTARPAEVELREDEAETDREEEDVDASRRERRHRPSRQSREERHTHTCCRGMDLMSLEIHLSSASPSAARSRRELSQFVARAIPSP